MLPPTSHASKDAPHGPRVNPTPSAPRTALLNGATISAAILAAAIFVVDLDHSLGFGIAALYALPLLVGTVNGPPRFQLAAAGVVSTLRRWAALLAPRGTRLRYVVDEPRDRADPDLGDGRRPRHASGRPGSTFAPAQKDLADVNYALDKSAIVATTDTRGTHQVRQRQVLRDLEVLARGAARAGPPDPELRLSPEGVHPRAVGDDRQRPDLARRDPQSRQGRIALLGRHDDRAVPERAREAVSVHGASATRSPAARNPRSGCRNRRRSPASARWRRWWRTR